MKEFEQRELELKRAVAAKERRQWFILAAGILGVGATAAASFWTKPQSPLDRFDKCIVAKLPASVAASFHVSSDGKGALADGDAVAALVDPAQRTIVDQCSTDGFGRVVPWPVRAPVRVDGPGGQPGASQIVDCGGAGCTTDASGTCLLVLADVGPKMQVSCSVTGPSGTGRYTVDSSALAKGGTLSFAVSGGGTSQTNHAGAPDGGSDGGAPQSLQLARAVVNTIETHTPNQNYFVWAMSVGASSFGLDSGTFAILSRYAAQKGPRAADLEPYLARARRKDLTLSGDPGMKKLARSLATDPLVVRLADSYLDEGWWKPSLVLADSMGVKTPLGIAVLFDTRLEGPVTEDAIVNTVTGMFDGGTPSAGVPEKEWIRAIVKARSDAESRKQLQKLIDDDNWDLKKPITIYGQPLIATWLNEP
jgi:chitosanase